MLCARRKERVAIWNLDQSSLGKELGEAMTVVGRTSYATPAQSPKPSREPLYR
jgi:hypothetical protein